MPVETERKFLVSGEFRDKAVKSMEIIQAYISVDPLKTIRIRIREDEAFLTIKSPRLQGKIGRDEWEYSIPPEDAKMMLSICLPGKIVKTRYLVPYKEHIFEVDVFHDKNEGLIIAELELRSEDEKFERPGWLGEEVTGDPKYYNSNLIK
jgi:CYTH domain-containing protein